MADRAAELSAHYAHCDGLLRAANRDLWLACLFAPAPLRGHLHAIHAFAEEAREVRAKVSQPMLGEMRLRWWADAIEGGAGARSHPVADALIDTIERFSLPRAEFVALTEARVFDLYDDPMETEAMLDAYLAAVHVAPLRWAARVLGASGDDAAVEGAGRALGLVEMLRALSALAGVGPCPIPADLLARHGAVAADLRTRAATPQLRAALAELRRRAEQAYGEARGAGPLAGAGAAALLPAATVPLFLERFEKAGDDPFRAGAEPPQWRRQWRLWRAARRGGL